MSTITIGQIEIELLQVKLEIAKAQQGSFSISSGSSTRSVDRRNILESLYKERDRLQTIYNRLANNGTDAIPMRGVSFQ